MRILNWPERAGATDVLSLKIKAIIFASTTLACAILPSSYALVQIWTIDRTIEQANAAGDVRRALEDIEDLGHDYAHFIENDGDARSPQGVALLRLVAARVSETRLLVAREVALAEPDDSGSEQQELGRLDKIEYAVRNVGPDNVSDLDNLIQAAIANERDEVADAEALLQRKLAEIEAIIWFEVLVAGVLALVLLLWLRRSLVLPLERLSTGAAKLAEGLFHTRIERGGVRELDLTIRQFNHMAEQMEVRHDVQLAAKEDLEAEVARRTAELRAAHDELAALATHRADFLADISHELRTPIAIVRGEADVTLRNRQARPEDYRDALERVLRQAEALTQLVDDLLFVARQGAGAPALKLELEDLAQIVRFAADDVRSLVEADGGEIVVNAANGAVIHCDTNRIGQVMRILIDNALRYCTRAPRVTITVSALQEGFAVTVQDNGVGIAEGETELIFERFRRGGNLRDLPEANTGIGLGLPLAKSIVEAHGGTISCRSTLGEGTAMTFTLQRTTIRMVA